VRRDLLLVSKFLWGLSSLFVRPRWDSPVTNAVLVFFGNYTVHLNTAP
jgi:hypothetical protein